MIVVLQPTGNEVSSICTFGGETNHNNFVVSSPPLSFRRSDRNNFHIKSHHLKKCAHVFHIFCFLSFIYGNGEKASAELLAFLSIPFLMTVVFGIFGVLIKRRCVTNGLENFYS